MSDLSNQDLLAAMADDKWQERATLRALARRSLYWYTKVIVCASEPRNLMDAGIFKERSDWLQWIVCKKKRGLLEDPRGHIKSTACSDSIPTWVALQRPDERYDHPVEIERANLFLAEHPHIRGVDSRLVIASESQKIAKKFCGNSKRHWEFNLLLRWLYPELVWPNINARTYGHWSEFVYSLPGRTRPELRDDFLRTVGLDTAEQGGRADGIIFNDLVGETSWQSTTELDKRRSFLRTFPRILEDSNPNSSNGGFIIVEENRWSLDDVNSLIHDEYKDWAIWRRGAFRCVVHGVTSCGRWGSEEANKCSPTDTPLWDSRYPTKEDLAAVEMETGPEIFAAQYMNDPTRAAELNESSFVPFRVEVQAVAVEGKLRRELCAITEKDVVPLSALHPHVISIDVASSTEPGAARTVVSWFAYDRVTARRFWLDCRGDRWSPDNAVLHAWELVKEVREKVGAWPRILVEKVAAQSYMASALKFRAQLDGERIGEIELIAPQRGPGKDDRIRRRVGNILGQRLLLLRAGLQLPRHEVRHFPTGTKDALDTCAQAEEVFQESRGGSNYKTQAASRKRARAIRIALSDRTGAPV